MTGQTSLSLRQRRLRLLAKKGQEKKSKKFGEVAGGTTAECAAVCCCCPFVVMNFLVLAVYKVPAGFCKKAWRKQKKRSLIAKRKQVGGILMGPTTVGPNAEEKVGQSKELLLVMTDDHVEEEEEEKKKNDEVDELEKEMWDRFREAGFWRSNSQKERETTPSSCA